jgi:hypothetical protein
MAFAVATLCSSLAWANGQEFFDPGANAKVDLAYVGRVRDINGRFLKAAEVVIWSDAAGLTFPAVSDAYGHYRTPDIGASLKEVGAPVDPAELKIACALPGYELAKPIRIPKKKEGRVLIDFVMRPAGSGPPVDSAVTTSASRDAARHGSQGSQAPSSPLAWTIPGFLVLVVIGAAVRR